MAAATENRSAFHQRGEVREYDIDAAQTEIFKGTLVSRDASGMAVAATDTAAEALLGVASENVVIPAGGADGDKKVRVHIRGLFEFVQASLTVADIGKGAYVVDDQTIALVGTTTNDVHVGRIVAIPTSTTAVVALFERSID